MNLEIEKDYLVTIAMKVTISAPAIITRSDVDEDGYPDEDVEMCDDVDTESLLRSEIRKIVGDKPFELYDYE